MKEKEQKKKKKNTTIRSKMKRNVDLSLTNGHKLVVYRTGIII